MLLHVIEAAQPINSAVDCIANLGRRALD